MWEYDGFIAKAQLYFSRAADHRTADDGVLAHWLLLGLEFLLRAPLAKVHPTLLADMNGESIMAAAGYPKPNGHPTSISLKTVVERLGVIIPGFTKERAVDVTYLAGLRNAEAHSSSSPYERGVELWLPHFTRVVEAVCDHLELDPADLLGDALLDHGRALVDAADKRLVHEVMQRIKAAAQVRTSLSHEELIVRRARIGTIFQGRSGLNLPHEAVEQVRCPACAEGIPLELRSVRSTDGRIEEDWVYRDVVYVATALFCPVCTLRLEGTAEIHAAGIQQQYLRTERESLEERYADYGEPEYGND
ncbi:hypothetical protein LDL08_33020 [Nonomuraea glycinis]|uniref:Uncharacterized protein n=1 Tax=Nonomuraea glycinis TaxID=2047744 RepID=A0A918ADT5_9ACTN|nr:hypothetical protein [Nonomuraea glycinis]MCA2181012.1 hypothetical protein [Nonomuraea glycinis]GGP13214.1 hypothetical protein GCM10012278_64100 [Nonomuraea glycinis]